MKHVFLLFMAVVATGALWAGNVITYTATEKLSETTGQYLSGLHTNAFNVTITNHSFSNGTGTITFAGEVTSIGDVAFYSSKILTSITIPSSVNNIGEGAFAQCTSLTSVTIPSSVTRIGEDAFYSVNNIVYNGTATGSPWGAKCINGYVEGYLVYTDATKTTLCGCSSAATGSIAIPNSVTSITNRAFAQCTSLTSVTISNRVTSIGYQTFFGCSSLASINIPSGVTSIGDEAFYWCSSLTSVTISNGVISIGNNAFFRCSSLTSITIPKSVTSIGSQAFYECHNITSITCDAINPPVCGSSCYYNVIKNIPLYVPKVSIALYQAANEWKDFTNIQALKNNVIVTTSDSSKGVGLGSGSFSEDTTIYIGATPFDGYQFSHWDDGNTDNPRKVTVTKDTAFMAYFAPFHADTIFVHDTVYTSMLEVNSLNPTMGSAVVQICAIPEEGYQFLCWSDYNTSNPRVIDVAGSGPQTYTAIFTQVSPTALRSTSDNSTPANQKISYKGVVYVVTPDRTYTSNGQEMY